MEPLLRDGATQAPVELTATEPPRQRLIQLESAVNFRDIGGYRAGEGSVRWGRVFRADNLSHLTPADRETVRDLSITTVLDLRTSAELDGGRFPTTELPVNFHHLPLLDEVPDPDRFAMTPGMLGTQYVEIAQNAAPQIGRALRVLATAGTLPAVVHCAAGKDRTGVLIAVLLRLLGTDDEVIVADYTLSSQAMGRLRQSLIARYPEGREVIEGADELFSAAPTNISRFLDWVDDEFGSTEAFAASAGAGPEVVSALRTQLIETPE